MKEDENKREYHIYKQPKCISMAGAQLLPERIRSIITVLIESVQRQGARRCT
jgi:hypothetical protein